MFVAYPIVFHIALHTGSNSSRDFDLHTFPNSILQHLETAHDASWHASFCPPSPAHIGATPMGPLPKNLSIRLGAHRASIYGTTKAAKTMVLTAAAKDQARESHAIELMGRQIRPQILDKGFQDYQKIMDNAEVDTPPSPCPTSLFPRRPSPYRDKHEEVRDLTTTKPRTQGYLAESPKTPRHSTAKSWSKPPSPPPGSARGAAHLSPGGRYGCVLEGTFPPRRIPNAGRSHHRPIGTPPRGSTPLYGDHPHLQELF
jgi:hypothetical protein